MEYTAIKQVTSPLFLTAAYGRKYETAKQALIAWHEGADFKIVDGPYCSVRDYQQMLQDFSNIYIYYGKNQVVKV